MHKLLLASAMFLLALGTEVATARAALRPDAPGFTDHDTQAPFTSARSDADEIQAPRTAAGREDDIQAPRGQMSAVVAG